MQVRDGPAAVRGDARRGNATGLRAGKAAKGEPRVRRPAALLHPEPLAEGGFVLRRLSFLSVLLAVIADADRARGERQLRVEGKTHDDLRPGSAGRAAATRFRPSTPPACRRVLLRHHDVDVRRLREPDRQVRRRSTTGWVFKVNGVSPPVGADQALLKDGDLVLWYYATFGATGGPPTLELQRLPANCYVVAVSQRRRQESARGDRDAHG